MSRTDRWVPLWLVVGLAANLLPFAVFGRQLPDLSAGPFDNIWIAQFTAQITTGAPLTVAPDPWFRYVPQVVILEGLSLVMPITTRDALVVNASYTLVCEAVLLPLALSLFASTVFSRRAGVVTVFAVAVGHTLLIGASRAWGLPSSTWFYTDHWQWAWAMHWAVLSFTAVVLAGHVRGADPFEVAGVRISRSTASLVAGGVCLGLVASIQLVQGGLAAYVVAIPLLRERAFRSLAIVAGVSMVVALPNAVVYLAYPGRWLSQGIEKSGDGATTMSAEAFAVIAAALAAGLVLALLWPTIRRTVADRFSRWSLRRDPETAERLRPDGAGIWGTRGRLLLSSWVVVAGGLVVALDVADALWFTNHTAYFLKSATLLLVGGASSRLLP